MRNKKLISEHKKKGFSSSSEKSLFIVISYFFRQFCGPSQCSRRFQHLFFYDKSNLVLFPSFSPPSFSPWDNITQVGMTWAESVIPMKLLPLSATQSQTVANRTVIYQELSLQAHCLMTPGADPLCLLQPRAAHTLTLIKLTSGEMSLWKRYHRDFAEGLVNYSACVYHCQL